MSRSTLLVLSLLLAAGPAWGLRATSHLDALETTLAIRAAEFAGATDKSGKKQLKAAEKSVARIAVDTTSLAEDLKLAKKVAGPVAKAFASDDEVMDLLTAAADAFEAAVDSGASVLARAREGLPEAKLTKKADRLLGKAEKLRGKAAAQAKLKKRLSLLYKAQRQADKAADVLAEALGDPTPTRLVLSPASALLTEPGETRNFRAVVLDQLERPMLATVSFVSSDPSVATVTPSGLVSAGNVGSAQIVASVGDLETAAMVVSARTAPSAILVGDDRVASLPEPVDEGEPYGVGFRYTVELLGTPPALGDLVVGTGQLPIGGLVVEVAGADPALVTLEIRPLDELFADLVIDEQIHSGPENLEVPADVLDAYDVEPGENGAYVFVPKDPDAELLPTAQARGVQGTVSDEVGPFFCSSTTAFNLGLNTAPTFTVQPSVSIDLQYEGGLQRLVATGGATLSAVYKPRLQTALAGKITCKARLFAMTISVPGPIAFIVGGYVPIGIGFEASGTITFANAGFDAAWSDSFSVEVGIDCTAGPCEAVAGAPAPPPPASPPPPPFQWVLPNLLTDFNVALGISAFGYFELRVGNPLWETLQLKMVEGQAGLAQTANFAPSFTQILNATSASNYKLTLFAKVGSGVSLQNILDLFNVNIASFEVKGEFDVAASPTAVIPTPPATTPDGSLAFTDPVAVGDEVEATVVLKDVTYLGLENVEEVRFYRKGGGSLTLRDAVARTQDGQTEYVGRWDAVNADLGAEFGVLVKTTIPVLEFEIENDSVRTLEESLDWTVSTTLTSPLTPGVGEPLDVFVTDPSTATDVVGAHVTLSVSGGSANPTSGVTDANGTFDSTITANDGVSELTVTVEARDAPGEDVRGSRSVTVEVDSCGYDPDVAPGGSYEDSCQSCSVSGGILTCDCFDIEGDLQTSGVFLANCNSDVDISNQDGQLACVFCSES